MVVSWQLVQELDGNELEEVLVVTMLLLDHLGRFRGIFGVHPNGVLVAATLIGYVVSHEIASKHHVFAVRAPAPVGTAKYPDAGRQATIALKAETRAMAIPWGRGRSARSPARLLVITIGSRIQTARPRL